MGRLLSINNKIDKKKIFLLTFIGTISLILFIPIETYASISDLVCDAITSLIVLIGVVEVVKVGQQIIEASRLTVPTAPLWIYGVIFILYFLVCYPISLAASKLEKRWEK